MKLKINNPKFLHSILLLALLASCNTGNKVVSSFGKRKYTKGYYFNFITHKRPVLPAIAVNRFSGKSGEDVSCKKSSVLTNDKAIASISFGKTTNRVNQNKTEVGQILGYIADRVQNIATPITLKIESYIPNV